MFDEVVCRELILAKLTRRGKGEKHSPIRVITQVFEKDGTLVAEHDPSPETFSLMDLVHFHNWCLKNKMHTSEATPTDVIRWLDSISK